MTTIFFCVRAYYELLASITRLIIQLVLWNSVVRVYFICETDLCYLLGMSLQFSFHSLLIRAKRKQNVMQHNEDSQFQLSIKKISLYFKNVH